MSEIEIKNVSKKYETKDGTVEALKNVSLSIEQGDIYGIIGMSGAGKRMYFHYGLQIWIFQQFRK